MLLVAEAATWTGRCEGLRSSLAAQEAHAAALEQELGSRPTQQQLEELRQQARQGQHARGVPTCCFTHIVSCFASPARHQAGCGGSELVLVKRLSTCRCLQMRILQAVSGYAADEEDGADRGGGGGAAGPAPALGGRGALEAALVSKSRHLEHKLTTLRLELAEAKGGLALLLAGM